ncbi:MAG: WbqC family protein [Prevotellaceae bacterium]|jgi:hypothetical protein|nr:WbqC family protein [Prevotellaceae bacterium]
METKKNCQIILSTAYLPNVQYFSKLLCEDIIIEQHENYPKQTFRNRCEILSANGIISLTIPIKHSANKIKIRDVEIDYTDNWQRLHWRTINTAYRSSPFFVYYADDFLPFYEKKEKFLFDFNCKMLDKLIELIGIKTQITLSSNYLHNEGTGTIDCRNTITPKNKPEDPEFFPSPYYQVFSGKFGFQPNLSILDLLCNEGNNSYSIIENSTKRRTSTLNYFRRPL